MGERVPCFSPSRSPAGGRHAAAQGASGNVYGIVVDEQGGPVPGSLVTLTGVGAELRAATSARGEFHFLNLHPGEYKVKASLAGFATTERPGVIVNARQNAEVRLTMKVAAQAESLVVTAEAPLLDSRKSNVGVNVARLELESIPTARDPWVIVQSVPGVQTDRVNVGGSESGQQSYYAGKGSANGQNVWSLDGVLLTSLASSSSIGSSAIYFDFDSLEEIHTSTGGTDPSSQTPGVQVNLVTKRGTNDLHGSARILVVDQRWVGSNISDELQQQLAAGGKSASGNSVTGMQDYGAEGGGPLVSDRLWLWGAYGRNQIDLVTAGGLTDKTTLETLSFKVNAQPAERNSAVLFFNRQDKIKLGRDAGLTRPQETSYDQTGPNSTFKVEDSHVFSGSFFTTVAAAYGDFGFGLVPEGSGQMRQDSAQVYHNTYDTRSYYRPTTQVGASASWFGSTGAAGHEIKLGGLYDFNKVEDTVRWEGNVVACNAGANFCGSQAVPSAALNRDFPARFYVYNYSAYLSDTITLPNLTVTAGLRFDYQYGENAALTVPGSAGASLVPPGTLVPPAVSTPAVDPGYRWEDWQPRLGAAWSFGQGRTLLRASYARYANQLGGPGITPYSLIPGSAGVVYPWSDANGNNHVDEGELDTSRLLRSYGFDPANPSGVSSINGVDPAFGSVRTSEGTLGLERELAPKLAVSVVGTWRKMTNFEMSTGFGLTQADYILSTTTYRENGLPTSPLCSQAGYACGVLPDGTRYNAPVYRVKPGVAISPGQYTRNNPDYSESYLGLEIQATKRYSDRWMARLSFSYNDWRQSWGANGYADPTNIAMYDGGLAVVQSLGSGDKSKVYMNARWQLNLSAMWSLPLGFSLSGNFFAREGYPLAYFQNVTANPGTTVSYDRNKTILVAPYEAYRLGTVSNLDLGLAKVLAIGPLELKLMAEVFNVLNRNTALQRQNQIGVTGPNGTNAILEIQSPRLARFGVRMSF